MTYDNATEAWLELDSAIVGSPDVHSQNNKAAGEEVAHAIGWFQENYNITKSDPDWQFQRHWNLFPDHAGLSGAGGCVHLQQWLDWRWSESDHFTETWPEESLQKIAEEGIAIWVIQGETDPLANPINSLKSYQD